MANQFYVAGAGLVVEDGEDEYYIAGAGLFKEDEAAAAAAQLTEREYPRGINRGVTMGVA